jgi:hypothetical protein
MVPPLEAVMERLRAISAVTIGLIFALCPAVRRHERGVLLDPAAQGPEGAGTGKPPQVGGGQGGPSRAGRSRFLLLTTALIAAGCCDLRCR